MARHGRGFPVRGVTVNGPKFTVYVGPPPVIAPDGALSRVVHSRPVVRGVVPIRPRPTIRNQAEYPVYVGPPATGFGMSIVSRRPLSRLRPLHPQATINRGFAPDICYLNFVLTARANIDFELEEPSTTVGMGRDPLDFVIVHCRNEA